MKNSDFLNSLSGGASKTPSGNKSVFSSVKSAAIQGFLPNFSRSLNGARNSNIGKLKYSNTEIGKKLSSISADTKKSFRQSVKNLKQGKIYNPEAAMGFDEEDMAAFEDIDDMASGGGDDDDFSMDDIDFNGDDEGMDPGSDDDLFDDDSDSTINENNTTVNKNTIINSSVIDTTPLIKAFRDGLVAELSVLNDGYQNQAKAIQTQTEQQTSFYNNTLKSLENIEKALTAVAANTKKESVRNNNKTSSIEDLISGNIGLKEYFHQLDEKLADEVDSYASMVTSLAADPFGSFTKMMLGSGLRKVDNKLLGGKLTAADRIVGQGRTRLYSLAVDKIMDKNGNIDLTGLLGGHGAGLLGKANDFLNDDKNIVGQTLRQYLGMNKKNGEVSTAAKFKNPATPVPFDAETHTTINRVLPGYLAKIVSAVNGKEEIYHDYSTGKWQTKTQTTDTFYNRARESTFSSDATYIIEDFFKLVDPSDSLSEANKEEILFQLASNRIFDYDKASAFFKQHPLSNKKIQAGILKAFKEHQNTASSAVYQAQVNLNQFYKGNDQLASEAVTGSSIIALADYDEGKQIKQFSNIFDPNSSTDNSNNIASPSSSNDSNNKEESNDDKKPLNKEDIKKKAGDYKKTAKDKVKGFFSKFGKKKKNDKDGMRTTTNKSEAVTPEEASKLSSLKNKVSKFIPASIIGEDGKVSADSLKNAKNNLTTSFNENEKVNAFKDNTKAKYHRIKAKASNKKDGVQTDLDKVRESIDKQGITEIPMLEQIYSQLESYAQRSNNGEPVTDKNGKLKSLIATGKDGKDYIVKLAKDGTVKAQTLVDTGKEKSKFAIAKGKDGKDYLVEKVKAKKDDKDDESKEGGLLDSLNDKYNKAKDIAKIFTDKDTTKKQKLGKLVDVFLGDSASTGLSGLSSKAGILGTIGNIAKGSKVIGKLGKVALFTSLSIGAIKGAYGWGKAMGDSLPGEAMPEGNPSDGYYQQGDSDGDSGSGIAGKDYGVPDASSLSYNGAGMNNGSTGSSSGGGSGSSGGGFFSKVGSAGKKFFANTPLGKTIGWTKNGGIGKAFNSAKDVWNGKTDNKALNTTVKAAKFALGFTPLGMIANMGKTFKNNLTKAGIKGDYLSNPAKLAEIGFSFTPFGMLFGNKSFYNPTYNAVKKWFKKFRNNLKSLGKGSSGSSSSGSGGSGGTGSTADKKKFLSSQINADFHVDKEKMIKDFSANDSRVKAWGVDVDKLYDTVKNAGVSPAFFFAYDLQEQGTSYGWLNHTGYTGDPYGDAKSVCEWIKSQSQKELSVSSLAWTDAGHPGYTTPKDKQEKAKDEIKDFGPGTIARVYLSGTAAATWAVFDPAALKGSVNGVQDYGDPVQGCMDKINQWGGSSSSSGSSATPSKSESSSSSSSSSSSDSSSSSSATPSGGAGGGQGDGGGDTNNKTEKMIAWGKSQIGASYSMVNRTGPNSYDCSGFVWCCMKNAGFAVPNTPWATPFMTADIESNHQYFDQIDQDKAKRGDICVTGGLGGGGAAGHTFILLEDFAGDATKVLQSSGGQGVNDTGTYKYASVDGHAVFGRPKGGGTGASGDGTASGSGVEEKPDKAFATMSDEEYEKLAQRIGDRYDKTYGNERKAIDLLNSAKDAQAMAQAQEEIRKMTQQAMQDTSNMLPGSNGTDIMNNASQNNTTIQGQPGKDGTNGANGINGSNGSNAHPNLGPTLDEITTVHRILLKENSIYDVLVKTLKELIVMNGEDDPEVKVLREILEADRTTNGLTTSQVEILSQILAKMPTGGEFEIDYTQANPIFQGW